jgi:uncharacterized protein
MIKPREIIQRTEEFVKEYMKCYDDSHSFEHVLRVKKLATEIAISENLSDKEIFEVQLAALTHDINDHKYSVENETQEETLAHFFKDILDTETMNTVIRLACNVSLSKEISSEAQAASKGSIQYNSIQLDCVRDADRIESLGAIGISRYFTYGILKNNNNIDSVIKNIESRTAMLIGRIKTTMGKMLSIKKYKIVMLFIEDYYSSLE